MGLLMIGKWHAYVCFLVVDLVFDCVLGLPWLTRVNPQLDWAARKLAVKMSGVWVQLPTVASPKAFASLFEPCKGPDSDKLEAIFDWEVIEAHVKLLSITHTAVECVKPARIALMQKFKLTALGCPKCNTIALERLVPTHSVHKCACCVHEWKVGGVCSNPIADLHPSLTK